VTRTRASAKAAGSTFERLIADYLAKKVDDRIDRRVKTGAKDKGDIAGVRFTHHSDIARSHRVVLENKDYGGRLLPARWVAEAEEERDNDGALVGLVIAKRKGTTDPGKQWVIGTVDDLVALLTGRRA